MQIAIERNIHRRGFYSSSSHNLICIYYSGREGELQSDELQEVDNVCDDYHYESSNSSAYGDSNFTRLRAGGSLYLNKYAPREDLSQLLSGDSLVSSDFEMDERRSLSPSHLREVAAALQVETTEDINPTREVVQSTLDASVQASTHSSLSEIPDPSATGTPEHRKLKQLQKDRINLAENTSATVEFVEEPALHSPTAGTVGSAILVSVESNARDNHIMHAAEKDSVTSTNTSRSQMDARLNQGSTYNEKTHPTHPTGPRSITVSGLNDSSWEPSGKYRKVDSQQPRVTQSSASPVYVSTLADIPNPNARLNRAATIASPAELISRGGFTLTDHVTEHGTYTGTVRIRRSLTESAILTPGKVITTDLFAYPYAEPRALNFGDSDASGDKRGVAMISSDLVPDQTLIISNQLSSSNAQVQGYVVSGTHGNPPVNMNSGTKLCLRRSIGLSTKLIYCYFKNGKQ